MPMNIVDTATVRINVLPEKKEVPKHDFEVNNSLIKKSDF